MRTKPAYGAQVCLNCCSRGETLELTHHPFLRGISSLLGSPSPSGMLHLSRTWKLSCEDEMYGAILKSCAAMQKMR